MKNCPRCESIGITDETDMCSACARTEYDRKIEAGEIVILKLDMNKVKKSTLNKIRFLIFRDISEEKEVENKDGNL